MQQRVCLTLFPPFDTHTVGGTGEEDNGGDNNGANPGMTINGDGTMGGEGGGGPPRSSLEPSSAIKMLVSASLAGCLIGKGGSTIHDLQERTGARIKLSQNNDFFPGT